MKKNVLTLLGALAALGLASCQTPVADSSVAPASESAQTSASAEASGSKSTTTSASKSSTPASSSTQAGPTTDATGHIWAADTDEAGDTETGAVAYKKALTTTPATDKAVRFKVNESVVTLNSGSTRKSGTPSGYIKVTSDNMGFSFKLKLDKNYTGKLYLYGVMDGWSSNTGSSFFNNGTTQNTKIEINGEEVDMSAQKGKTYLDYFGDGTPAGDGLSPEGYAPIGDVVLRAGVNTIAYTRVKTLNMLVKDFVFVVEEAQEWSAPTEVPADATAGTVAYKKYTNNFDGSVKIEFKATDGALSTGAAIKSGTPDGYLKLDANTQSISYKFNLDANLDGKLYQRGMMDNYSGSNKNCTYYSQSKGAQHGNFKATLNGTNVYFGDKKAATYASMFGDETQTIGEVTYSAIKDCEIGEGFLKNGENTFTYERVDSYNLAISDFVFIGKAANAHAALDETAEWKKDEISHWKEMPNDSFKWNRADNVWEADPDHTSTPATCTNAGKAYEKEAESGLTREVDLPLDPEAHTWEDGTPATNTSGKTVTPIECSGCHKKGAKISVNDYEGDAATNVDTANAGGEGSFKPKKVDIGYKLIVPATGYYNISLGMVYLNNGTTAMSSRSFEVKVNGTAVALTLDTTKTPEQLGISKNGDPKDIVLAGAQLEAGEVTISFKNPDYRVAFKGYVMIVEAEAPAAPETPAENA